MTMVHRGDTVWLTPSTRGRGGLVGSRRLSGPILARALGLGALAAGIFAAAAIALPPPDAAKASIKASAALKDEARLPQWNGPLGPRPEARAPEPTTHAVQDAPRPAAVAARPASPDGWREEEFPQVSAVDGRTLEAGGLRIRLEGLEPSSPDEVCRTLDGRLESCATRLATQLELITRWRKVTCRLRNETPSEAVGACRIGSTDLAERLAKTGYAHRTVQASRTVIAEAARLD